MGMGDARRPFKPPHTTTRCDVTGYVFADCLMRQCPHPGVIKRYGSGGTAHVCHYVCRKCKHKGAVRYTSALRCDYVKED